MVFRVYALCNRSRTILYVLLFIWTAETVINITSGIMYSMPGAMIGVSDSFIWHVYQGHIWIYICCGGSSIVLIPPAPNPSVCILQYPSWDWGRYSSIPLVVLQSVMCIIGIFQGFRQSFQLYKAFRRWQFNQFVMLFVEQGILYFLMCVHPIFCYLRQD